MSQQWGFYPQQNYQRPPQLGTLKGRPVTSIEEVRAAPIDFDGTTFIFPNLGNNTIFTKQINLDGTSSIKMYKEVEIPTETNNINLVTKEEFDATINNLLQQIQVLKAPKDKKEQEEYNF